jgi:hypothetical protein
VTHSPGVKPSIEAHSGLLRVREERKDRALKDAEKPLPLRALLTRAVMVSVANYGMIGLLEIIAGALIPLVWSTSIEFGGLGMSPASIGLWMAGYGFLNGIIQFVAFPPIVGRLGLRLVFIASVFCFFPIYIMFPFENLAMRLSSGGLNPTAALFIVLQLSALSFADMGFSELPNLILSTSAEVLFAPIRCDICIRILCCPQQAISRRHKWNRADDGLNSAHDRTSSCRVVVCILAGQEHLGGKLYVCRIAYHRVGWARPRCTASAEHVETRWRTVNVRRRVDRIQCALILY